MPTGDVETFHLHGNWHNRIEGSGGGVFGTFSMKDEAVRVGRDQAHRRRAEHIIRNLDVIIGEATATETIPAT
ncbi:DUF2188 domain-containing protein [Rhodococcus sp. F64268]|uniref:DUF2188 domain-containing protein n=1 Tax=Rhodococcus sp. F64268 TaxID=2926402 RepID=UPI001FF3E9AA|nr:DUF2188 domain-containing protein [Rhodococcus sp. F64268]MCK0090187.1 DUF2188 domain-containing protein [Rhodococcus sp. F64268]